MEKYKMSFTAVYFEFNTCTPGVQFLERLAFLFNSSSSGL